MEATISIQDMVHILKKRWKLIMFTTLVATVLSGSISYFVLTPIYQASTQILVNQKNENTQLDFTQMKSNIDLINTYSVIIKSPAILEKVIENFKLTQTVDQLNQQITINSQDNSQVFSLTVEDPDADRAVKIANAVSETFQKEIQNIMNVDNVSILAKAEVKEHPTPIKPDPLLNIAVAVVVGLMIGIGWAFLLEHLDHTMKDSDDVEASLDLPILGTIQIIPQVKGKKKPSIQKSRGETIEPKIES